MCSARGRVAEQPTAPELGVRFRAVLVWAVALGAFTLLSVLVFRLGLSGWDIAALRAVERLHGDTQDAVMRAVTQLGSWFSIALLTMPAAAALLLFRRPRTSLSVVLAVAGAGALEVTLKLLFGRPRPHVFAPLVHETSASFPSGHATVTAALAIVLCLVLWHTRARWAAVACGAPLVLLVSFSRTYLGVHYPSDLLAGWLVATASVALVVAATAGPPDTNDHEQGADEKADPAGQEVAAARSPAVESSRADVNAGSLTAPRPAADSHSGTGT